MNNMITQLKFFSIILSAFTYFLYMELINIVSFLRNQLKINMTGAIGVLESIYVHNAFQCIIGVAPVAIFVKKNSVLPESILLPVTNTACGKSSHGRHPELFRNQCYTIPLRT